MRQSGWSSCLCTVLREGTIFRGHQEQMNKPWKKYAAMTSICPDLRIKFVQSYELSFNRPAVSQVVDLLGPLNQSDRCQRVVDFLSNASLFSFAFFPQPIFHIKFSNLSLFFFVISEEGLCDNSLQKSNNCIGGTPRVHSSFQFETLDVGFGISL